MKKARTSSCDRKTNSDGCQWPSPNFLAALAPGASVLRDLISATREKRRFFRGTKTADIKEQAFLALVELAERVESGLEFEKDGKLVNSAEALATLGIAAANLLEWLSNSDSDSESQSIWLAAGRRNRWPVLLSIGHKQQEGGSCRAPILQSAAKAKLYLLRIGLGEDCTSPVRHFSEVGVSPFRRAAELLLGELYRFRKLEAWKHVYRLEPKRAKLRFWAAAILKLQEPITMQNVHQWWTVAKTWMDEAWKTDYELFIPLIAACKSRGKPLDGERHELFPSEVRRTIIDVRLKEAFLALAEPTPNL